MNRRKLLLSIFICFLIIGCGLNSVTKQELENVKVGNVLVYRHQKGGESWFFADKITRIEGDKIYFTPGKSESTKGTDARIREFGTNESSITKAELLKFETEQGEARKVIIWIE